MYIGHWPKASAPSDMKYVLSPMEISGKDTNATYALHVNPKADGAVSDTSSTYWPPYPAYEDTTSYNS